MGELSLSLWLDILAVLQERGEEEDYSYSHSVRLESYVNTMCGGAGAGTVYLGGKKGYLVRVSRSS